MPKMVDDIKSRSSSNRNYTAVEYLADVQHTAISQSDQGSAERAAGRVAFPKGWERLNDIPMNFPSIVYVDGKIADGIYGPVANTIILDLFDLNPSVTGASLLNGAIEESENSEYEEASALALSHDQVLLECAYICQGVRLKAKTLYSLQDCGSKILQVTATIVDSDASDEKLIEWISNL